jgi:hypothetical protein
LIKSRAIELNIITKLDPELLEQVKKCCPHLLEKPKEETDKTK